MKRAAPNWTDVRIALWERSRGRCEGCGRHLGNDGAVHHRRLRSRGGDHSLGNLMLLHTPCHTWAHANVATATGLGWIVSTWGPEPGDVPVILHRP